MSVSTKKFRKKLLPIPLALTLTLLVSACSGVAPANEAGIGGETITYESENGPIEVPTAPQRVVVVSTFAGNVLSLGVPVVGVDVWTMMNPRFAEPLKDAEEISEESLEKIIELEPDLIIGLSTAKNIDKLSEIAPTVTYTYGKLDYLTQHLEIGKLLNKEAEAKAWIDDFKKRTAEAGDEIRAKIGEDATVTIVENFEKELYVFGDNWGRGGEILYREMKLKMPQKVIDTALQPGYFALSLEALPEFVGDYLIMSKYTDSDTSFLQSETYKNIPAVKEGRAFEVDSKAFFFNDPITLEYQLEFFIDRFLGER
ncbi:iron-hydroxamate ABC transporter substrate-binding protein [Paenibacillus sp.]|uniref:iron-hydroxamate ABC transporter substrate-binding protein n=1 Tax=Paenibacillus sp. TaxID=58172 RepID=UPI002811717D|nr:iron-hydroxamate ABC transporter substrate-binding protein [Paenibacillus sp.]